MVAAGRIRAGASHEQLPPGRAEEGGQAIGRFERNAAHIVWHEPAPHSVLALSAPVNDRKRA